MRPWILLIALSLVLSLGIPFFSGGWEALSAFTQLSWYGMASLVGLMAASWLVQAGRLIFLGDLLGKRLRPRSSLGITMAAEFGHAGTPGGAGGPSTYLFLLTRYGFSVDQALAVQAVDQAMDLVFLASAIPVGLMFYALDIGSREIMGIALIVALLTLTGFWLLLWLLGHYRSAVLFLGRVINRLPRLHRVRYKLARFIVRFRHSVRVLVQMGLIRLLILYLFSLSYWMLRYSVLPLVFFFLDLEVHYWYLFLIQPLLLGAGLLTFLPGGGGGVELGYTALMRSSLSSGVTASTLLLWRFATFYFTLIACLPVFLFMTGSHAREIMGRPPEEEEAKVREDAERKGQD